MFLMVWKGKMRKIYNLIATLIFALAPHLPSYAGDNGTIPFASASPIKIAFPVPESIILFFNYPRCESCNQNLEVYALKPKGNMYEIIYVGSLDTDGDPPNVESIFLKNVDSQPGDELFILVSWESSHPSVGILTKNYAVYVFGRERNGTHGLKRLSDIEEKIGQTSEGTIEGGNGRPERAIAKYRNADDVRKILKNLGY